MLGPTDMPHNDRTHRAGNHGNKLWSLGLVGRGVSSTLPLPTALWLHALVGDTGSFQLYPILFGEPTLVVFYSLLFEVAFENWPPREDEGQSRNPPVAAPGSLSFLCIYSLNFLASHGSWSMSCSHFTDGPRQVGQAVQSHAAGTW